MRTENTKSRDRQPIWPYALLSVALVGALVFGAYQTKQKNQLALLEENKYMQAFHKLKWTSENLEDMTAKLMASNTLRMQQTILADIRVMTTQAVEHMAFLPLLTTNIQRTQNYLNSLRQTADHLHYQVGEGTPITEEQWANLRELQTQSAYFEKHMGELLSLVAGGNVRWADTVAATSPQSSGNRATPITRSLMLLEQNWQPPPGEEGAMNPANAPIEPPPRDLGPRVDHARAIEAVKEFFPDELDGDPKVIGEQDPVDKLRQFSLYFLSARKKNGTPLDIGVSVHGGHVIYVIDGRPVTEVNHEEDDLAARGKEFLLKHKYPPVEFISAAKNNNTLIMAYAPIDKNGVILLTDLIRVTYAQDNAEILGFDAVPYWQFHKERDLKPPVLSEAAVRAAASPRLKVEKARLMLVATRQNAETLAWELTGTMDDQQYLVYFNAYDGREESIRRLTAEPPG